jgi:hypothetical protein
MKLKHFNLKRVESVCLGVNIYNWFLIHYHIFVKWSSGINLIYSGQQLFSYNSLVGRWVDHQRRVSFKKIRYIQHYKYFLQKNFGISIKNYIMYF